MKETSLESRLVVDLGWELEIESVSELEVLSVVAKGTPSERPAIQGKT